MSNKRDNVAMDRLQYEKEYIMLREEMMYNQKHRDHLAQFGYTVTFAVITAALSINNAWLMLCIIPFLFPITLRIAECSHSIAYLASYMETHLENKVGYVWETKSSKFQKVYKRKGIGKIIYYASRLDFPILTLVSSALFWLLRDFDFYIFGNLIFGLIILIIQLLVVTIEMLIVLRFANIAKTKMILIEQWKKI